MIKKIFSDKIISSLILLNMLSSLFLFFIFNFSKDDISGFYINFFVYSILTLFLLIFSLLLNKNGKNIFKIFVFSIIFSIYFVEIYLHFYNKSKAPIEDLNFRKIQAEKLGIEFDNRQTRIS